MLVKDIVELPDFELINESDVNIEINNIFACDLLSHAMGFADENDLLITVLNNVNVLGVASLLDFSGVVFSHKINVNQAIIEKANELGIPLIKTALPTAQAVIKITEAGERD